MDIISKWTVKYKRFNLGITEDKRVYDFTSKKWLVPYWNNGVISFRIPGTSIRIGKNTINRYCKLEKIIIYEYCPF